MMKFLKTVGDELVTCSQYEDGVWVYMINPTESEISLVCEKTKIEADFIRSALDEEKRPRIEIDMGQTLILVDIPTAENDSSTNFLQRYRWALSTQRRPFSQSASRIADFSGFHQ